MRLAERSRHAFTSLASARLLCGRCIQLSEVSEIQHHPHQVRSPLSTQIPPPLPTCRGVGRWRCGHWHSRALRRRFRKRSLRRRQFAAAAIQPCRAAVLHDCAAAQQPPFAAAAPVTPSQRRAQPYRRGRADPLGLQLTQFALVTVDRVWELRCASEDETHQWMDGEPFSRVPQCSCRSPIVE